MGNAIVIEEVISKDFIDKTIGSFKEKMDVDEKVVQKVFDTFDNNSIESIMIKTIVLNNRYSAGLYDRVSEVEDVPIDVLSISKLLKEYFSFIEPYPCAEEPKVIMHRLLEKYSNMYEKKCSPVSFLSKYIHWDYFTNGVKYDVPIYDGFSKGMVYRIWNGTQNGNKISQDSLKDYASFYDHFIFLKDWINEKMDTSYSVKQLDMFFWMFGKENGIYI